MMFWCCVTAVVSSVCRALGDAAYAQSKYDLARQLLAGTIAGRDYADFLTNLCYDHIVTATVRSNL
jgi:hypothetical protein